MWSEIFTAVALVLVIEGLIPFISPMGYRKAVSQLAQLPPRGIRITGFLSMLLGILILYGLR
ncbi:MAG TPA: DUF2065 domain-containing protein [Gammaproteobacteria bacterium]|nr:DUF2065 domain-containing protein [Gammaproteobacteria bacterium]